MKPTKKNEDRELSEIFLDNDDGPDSWLIDDDGTRWVYLSDGMYISECGIFKIP